MFKWLQVLKDPVDYRIINLLNNRRLANDDLQEILRIPIPQIQRHLEGLRQMEIISCDLNSPPDMCRVQDSFIENNPIFYALAEVQMKKSPVHQDDLNTLKKLQTGKSISPL